MTRVGGWGGERLQPSVTTEGPPGMPRASWPAPGFKGLRLTAGRRPTWVYATPMLALVGPILSKVKLSGAHLGPMLKEGRSSLVQPWTPN